MPVKKYTYLALGDSYTIGEGVPLDESFPYQLVQMLRRAGLNFTAPEIIAKTGWTTEDLKKGIRKHVFLTSYDFVSILIGVNNQFKGLDINEYALQFEQLLKQAIAFAGGENRHVFVLSVPDWGNTPYAEGKDRATITKEISKYNLLNKNIAEEYKVQYISQQIPEDLKVQYATVTSPGRIVIDDESLAEDQLHPSGKEYRRWAQLIANEIQALVVYDNQV